VWCVDSECLLPAVDFAPAGNGAIRAGRTAKKRPTFLFKAALERKSGVSHCQEPIDVQNVGVASESGAISRFACGGSALAAFPASALEADVQA